MTLKTVAKSLLLALLLGLAPALADGILNPGASSGGGGGSGTVTSVSVTTANGVSGTVATATTTPAISLTLGAITPTTVNGNTFTTGTGTLTMGAGKTITLPNSFALTATDGSTLAIGTGGTLGANAYTSGFTITANSTATSGCSANTVLYSDGSKVQCSATLPFALAVTPIQAANTSVDGYVLADPTAATVNNQQFSPRLRLTGQGWKTTATAGSETVDWIIENQPVQGTTTPTELLAISAQINGAGYTNVLNINSIGTATRPTISFPGDLATGIFSVAAGNVDIAIAAVDAFRFNSSNEFLGTASLAIKWGIAVTDTTISRKSAGIIQIGTTTSNDSGTLDATAYQVGGSAGASCTLTTVSHLTVVNGIVTLCN